MHMTSAAKFREEMNSIKLKDTWFEPPAGSNYDKGDPPPAGSLICFTKWALAPDGFYTGGPNTLTWTQPAAKPARTWSS